MRTKIVWSLLVAAACLFGATNLAAKASAVDNGSYTTKDAEFYLTPEQLLFIRKGLVAEIISVSASAGSRPEVTFSITDPEGLPLDNTGVTTPGAVDFRFTLANYPAGSAQKVRVAYERDSRNGTLTALGNGVYKYKFDYVMDTDPNTTHTLVLGFRRDLRDFDLDRYAANDIYNWVPSGMTDPAPRDVVTTETCNRCHDPITMHGGRWLSVEACAQCHNPALTAEESSPRSMDDMVHALHMGPNREVPLVVGSHDYSHMTYPTAINDCEVCHTGGTPTADFPMVATPAAALVCDGSGRGETTLNWEYTGGVELQVRANANATGKVFARGGPSGSAKTGKWVSNGMIFDLYDRASMQLIQSLTVDTTVLGCSGNAPGMPRGVAGKQHTNWMTNPTRRTCGSCHDGVDFASGDGHIKQTTDGSCYFCHEPDTGDEYDLSVAGAHQVAFKSGQMPGILIELLGITDTDPGDTPTVSFTVGNKYGPVNPANLDRLRAYFYGPNTDVIMYAQETVGSKAFKQGGAWHYTFETPLPMDATGSYTVSFEAYNEIELDMGMETEEETNSVEQTTLAFAVTDSAAKPRRMIVDDEKCEACHENLGGHHGRTNAQFCVSCHNPDLIDIAPVPESVNMKWMTHKIHRGSDLENGYIVVRNRGTYNFSHVEFPGDLRNCETCHVNGSEQLPLPSGLLSQLTPNFWWTDIEPVSAACLSCHDSDDAAVHAFVNTSFFGESCSTCHGEDKGVAVDKVHAR